MQWLPLVGCLTLFATLIWRVRLQRRRFGGRSVLLLRSGDWRQKVRDALAVTLAVGLGVQAVTAAARPAAVHRLVAPGDGAALVGAALMFGGIALLVRAQLDLGRAFRIGVDEAAKPGLETGGLYRLSRNPIYGALLVMIAGYALLLPTPLSVVLLIGAAAGFRQQVLLEETYLARTYGDEFRAYAARVGRFVPGVGLLRR